MADVQRAGRVRADELDVHALRRAGTAPAEVLAGRQHVCERRRVPVVGEEEVQKAGARHLDASDQRSQALLQLHADALCHLARWGTDGGRQQHRDVGGVVAEVLALRALQRRAVGDLPVAAQRLRCIPQAAAQEVAARSTRAAQTCRQRIRRAQ